MKYLIVGSSLRGLEDVARQALSEGNDVAVFDAEHPGVSRDLASDVTILPDRWETSMLDGVDRVVASPWFSDRTSPLIDAIDRGIDVITEAGFGLERLDLPFVAITGTNGKTTVTEVTTDMLNASGLDALSAGNVGTPLSSLSNDDASVLVLELSSYQLRFIGTLPAKAVALLNIAPDHLDWHGSMAAYTEAKERIFADLSEDALFVYNADDPVVSAMATSVSARTIACSGHRVPAGGNGVDGGQLVVGGIRFSCPTKDPTYRFNLLVAATLALSVGATTSGVRDVIASFTPGAHRREEVATFNGATFVNDSKATNPHATIAAATSYPSVVLLVGGRNKGLDLSPLIGLPSVRALVPFGESGPEIASLAGSPDSAAATLGDAFAVAAAAAEPGDTVLLSPGCASFDEFSSYAERGDAFKVMVCRLIEEAA